jgi:hypothetical protein
MSMCLRTCAALGALLLSCAAHAARAEQPGCAALSPRECVAQALAAIGGQERVAAIHSVRLDVIAHSALMEQSYRQAPFITSYERDKTTIDLAGGRTRTEAHLVWPESDLQQADSDNTLITLPAGGAYHGAHGDTPCSLADLDSAREIFALGPLRLLSSALKASDLHYEPAAMLRASAHAVVAFSWEHVPVRVLLNGYNHLPDALESTQQFRDFWYHWGDVQQRVYWDNWKYLQGISYPTNVVIERNGALWSSQQALDVQFNVVIDDKDFVADPKVVQQSAAGKGWEKPFNSAHATQLAPGVDLYSGSWNTTIVHQGNGVVILETPISATFTRGIFAEAARKYPGEKVTAVLTTSDSWPHVGGVRAAVAEGLPVYALDMNVPLLRRLLAAPHTLHPDPLQSAPRKPRWNIVAGKQVVGSGSNRMELYPLRGAATERQYLVYFPEHRLLYASDTLVLNADHTLYDPQLMHEVRQAVEREHLAVDTVYAMHESPTPWKDVVALLDASA